MSSTLVSTTSSGSASTPFPSPDPRQNANSFENGPSVYLYGFLATLVLIFLVSVAVAWRGYYTRRILRARIDEALARGLYVPGYSDDGTPLSFAAESRRRGVPPPPKPIIWDAWIDLYRAAIDEKRRPDDNEWSIKPAAVTAIKPAPNPEEPSTRLGDSPSHARTLIQQLVDPIREYWFVTPPQGAHANQLQGRPPPGNADPNDPQSSLHDGTEEKQDALKDVEGVIVNVLIAMPSVATSTQKQWGLRNQLPSSSSRPTSLVPSHQPREPEELPEVVIGCAELPLMRPPGLEPATNASNTEDNENQAVSNGKEPLR